MPVLAQLACISPMKFSRAKLHKHSACHVKPIQVLAQHLASHVHRFISKQRGFISPKTNYLHLRQITLEFHDILAGFSSILFLLTESHFTFIETLTPFRFFSQGNAVFKMATAKGHFGRVLVYFKCGNRSHFCRKRH